MTQARDGVFAAEERQQDAAVLGTEKVEALVVASGLGLGLGHLVEVLRADCGVVHGADELEVPAVRGEGRTWGR